MKIFEKILLGIFLLTILIKIGNYPANAFIAWSGLSLSLFYLILGTFLFNNIPLSFKNIFNLKEFKPQNSLLARVSFACLIFSIIFSLNNYPGQPTMLNIGLISGGIALFFAFKKESKGIIVRLAFYSIFGICIYFLFHTNTLKP